MSREELLRTFDESERFLKNLLQNGLKWIAKIQNLSQNEIKQIIKCKFIMKWTRANGKKKRVLKKYKNMSKEDLLISLLKSEQSIAEIRKKFHKKEKIDKYFGEEEKKNETKQEEREKKHYTKELKRLKSF